MILHVAQTGTQAGITEFDFTLGFAKVARGMGGAILLAVGLTFDVDLVGGAHAGFNPAFAHAAFAGVDLPQAKLAVVILQVELAVAVGGLVFDLGEIGVAVPAAGALFAVEAAGGFETQGGGVVEFILQVGSAKQGVATAASFAHLGETNPEFVVHLHLSTATGGDATVALIIGFISDDDVLRIEVGIGTEYRLTQGDVAFPIVDVVVAVAG